MKILLSAYACEPHKGSEPGIGWNWALEIARLGHEVWVITRENNRPSIETGLQQLSEPLKLYFIYYDLPAWLRAWKRGGKFIYLYYLLWQWGAYHEVKKHHAQVHFDWVHHITFGSARQPSFMGNLGIPFIFGPVAGGERAPLGLRKSFPFGGTITDGLRDVFNGLIQVDPLMHRTFRQARYIITTSTQTQALLPARYQAKSLIHLAIGASENSLVTIRSVAEGHFRVLYVGRLIYWKGIHLALHAFAQFHRHFPQSRFTIVGSGPDEQWLKNLATSLGLTESVSWIPWMERQDMMVAYTRHDIFLFPSLHDSGGMVVLEAMAFGLPVIALDLGGPGIMVDSSCGVSVQTEKQTIESVVAMLAESLEKLAADCQLLAALGEGAIERARHFSWDRQVSALYERIRP